MPVSLWEDFMTTPDRVRTAIASLGGSMFLLGSIATADVIPFTDEAQIRGLNYHIQSWQAPDGQFQGFGIAIVDLNNNGHQDVVVMGNNEGRVGIFENIGAGYFNDRSQTSGLPLLDKGSGIAVADFNGNGLLDIYITQQFFLPAVLARNDGNFKFTDVAAAAGVQSIGHGEGAAWGDYDNDGWLDLYVCNYTFTHSSNNPTRRNHLYRNLGDSTFESVGPQLGVDDYGLTYTAVWSDMNRNGKLDLYIANDRGHLPPNYRANQLWRNEGGSFTNISQESGAGLGLWAMCVGAGDFSGNGYPDFYVTNLPNVGGYGGINPLLINQGDETFVDEAVEAGVSQFIFSWTGMFFDFSNNGYLDLYVCNQGVANRLYANSGTYPLPNVANAANVQGGGGFSFNAAYGDVTGNGALDIVLNNYGINGVTNPVQLFINHDGATRNWIRYRVIGYGGNRNAIGANIDTRTGDRWQWREIYAGGNNFKSQNELVFHVGLDDATMADEIVVNWPGGEVTRTLRNYPANTVWTIYPPERLGDYDNNGVINAIDLYALLASWGTVRAGTEMMDINGDGVINVSDLLMLLNRWTAPQPPPRDASKLRP